MEMKISFYRPTAKRHKILLEGKAFPSDHYAIESQIKLRGYDPSSSMIFVNPREGESCIRTEDILSVIEKEGDSISVVCFSGVQYYTGQVFEIEKITQAGKAKGCYVGWDLAHAAGNVELFLHDWDVDFACWCTYKYLNSSAGCLAGIFVHDKYTDNDFPKLQGWWGHKLSTRFKMDNKMDSYSLAYAWRISNTPGLLCPPIKASLEIFNKTSMTEIRAKSRLLTAYLESLILQKYGINKSFVNGNQDVEDESKNNWKHVYVEILTPSDPEHRGAQLSLSFSVNITHVFEELQKRGVVVSLKTYNCPARYFGIMNFFTQLKSAKFFNKCDERKPSVIRVAPAPLYCSFMDVFRFSNYLDESLTAASNR
ncbi:hypothetical protein KUTeg_000302 [Tegillarca granosa]|uniref:Aminotransferase class V domain-containing protein n=1 Tax=Tegillarca granosa TaxID=220873 RepID=A0ABQ9FX66_TEGGR|nr:hypothetical protein KUTeg_000302 [Tegillarca granosa]